MLRYSSRVRVRTRRRRHGPSGAPPAPSSVPPTLPRPCPAQRTTPYDPYDQPRRPWSPCSTTTTQPGSCVPLGLRPGAPLNDFCDPATPFKPPRTVFFPDTLILLLFFPDESHPSSRKSASMAARFGASKSACVSGLPRLRRRARDPATQGPRRSTREGRVGYHDGPAAGRGCVMSHFFFFFAEGMAPV